MSYYLFIFLNRNEKESKEIFDYILVLIFIEFLF